MSAANESRSRLFAVFLAVNEYRNTSGALSPASAAPQSASLHSWRTLILPYLKPPPIARESYLRYDFEQPWNSRHNLGVVSEWERECPALKKYLCLAVTYEPSNETTELLVEEMPSTGGDPVAFVEIAADGHRWTEPIDIWVPKQGSAQFGPGQLFSIVQVRVLTRSGSFFTLPSTIQDKDVWQILHEPQPR
jgi:hypothetical protein